MGRAAKDEEGASAGGGQDRAEGWKWTLAWLPVAVIAQAFLLNNPWGNDGGFAILLALGIDLLVAVRSLVGLRWQPGSRDWLFYCLLPFAIIPIAAVLAAWGEALARR